MAYKVKDLLYYGKVDEAFDLILKDQDVMKWKDAGCYNYTLLHKAAMENCHKFLKKVFENEKVGIIL